MIDPPPLRYAVAFSSIGKRGRQSFSQVFFNGYAVRVLTLKPYAMFARVSAGRAHKAGKRYVAIVADRGFGMRNVRAVKGSYQSLQHEVVVVGRRLGGGGGNRSVFSENPAACKRLYS